jgi:hypothetical protein
MHLNRSLLVSRVGVPQYTCAAFVCLMRHERRIKSMRFPRRVSKTSPKSANGNRAHREDDLALLLVADD